jgi:hypothetical protein
MPNIEMLPIEENRAANQEYFAAPDFNWRKPR